MSNKMLVLAGALMAVLSVGAGCVVRQQSDVIQPTKTTTSNSAVIETVEVPPIKELSWIGPTTCLQEAAVAFQNTDDSNTSWEITLNGQVVKTVTAEGEHSMDNFKEVTGMNFLVFNPSGVGGYIPYGLAEKLFGVDYCTGKVIEVIAPSHLLTTGFQDISDNGALAAFVSSDNGKKVELGIMNVGASQTPYTSPTVWAVPGDWTFGGSAKFNALATKLAVAVGNGPDNQNGAVYVLDLATGQFTQLSKNSESLMRVDGWDGDTVLFN